MDLILGECSGDVTRPRGQNFKPESSLFVDVIFFFNILPKIEFVSTSFKGTGGVGAPLKVS